MRRSIGEWRVLAMDLWYSPGRAADTPVNRGLDRATDLLRRAAAVHLGAVRLIDASAFAEFERWQIYARHARHCTYWGYAVADAFGSRVRAGSYAGLSVPLLSIHYREAGPACVAPHHATGTRPRALRTILDLLSLLDPAEQKRLFGEPV
ncbi:MAG TPA: hypothetical protein VNM16_03265 [Bacillota bacterium]|nr:hypothetical protein [Bacillota bacterium]